MTILIKAGTGLVAGMVAGALGLAFLPRLEPNAVKPRNAVGTPQFVVASPAETLAGSAPPRAAAVVAVSADAQAAKFVSEAKTTPEVIAAPAEPAKVAAAPPAVAKAAVAPPAFAKAAVAPVAVVKADPPKVVAAPMVAKADAQKSVTPEAGLAPVAVAPRSSAVSDVAARWSVQGLVALAKGDLSSARLYLTRAAEAGDARAWLALADTYDPAMLTKLGVVIAPGDTQRAKDCLQKAAAGGVMVAKDRMAALDQDSSVVH